MVEKRDRCLGWIAMELRTAVGFRFSLEDSMIGTMVRQ